MGALLEIQDALEAGKKKRKAKEPETLDQAVERLTTAKNIKWSDDERSILDEVIKALQEGELVWDHATKKLNKKDVMALKGELFNIRRDRLRQHVIDTKPDNFWIVQDTLTLDRVRRMLQTEPETAWDTETTGLDIFMDRIVGWSVYMPTHDVAVYVPFGHETGQTQVPEAEAMAVAKEYLQNRDNRTIWHHYKYDGHMLMNYGIVVANPYWDTMSVSKILNEHELSHSLKNLYAKYISDEKAILFEDLFDDFKIYDKDIILSGIYAAGDGHKTYKLYLFQKPFIDSLDNLRTVWYEIETNLLHVDLMLEREGFRIDLEHLQGLSDKFAPVLAQAEADLRTAFSIDADFVAKMNVSMERDDEDFNLQSPHHLGYLIYDVLMVDPRIGSRFNKPFRSTAAEVVDAICEDHEQLKPLLKYRKLNKLITTYVDKIPHALEPTTGKIHCRFNNLGSEDDKKGGAATGRYSSSEYVSKKHSKTGIARGTNLQNIPSKGEGVEVRRAFVPDPDWIFLGADLSQIEPRIIATILADVYGDKSMQTFYLDGKDLYVEMAMLTFGFDREHCLDSAYDPSGEFQPRKLMKQGVLSYLYGSSARAFARNMGVSEEIAAMFFDKMIAAFPGLADFRADVIEKLMTKGNNAYSETLYGRKRRFPTYRKNRKEFDEIEDQCYKAGLKIYVQKNQDDEWSLKGRDEEELSQIEARRQRVRSKKLIEGDRDAITKIGLYWRFKHLKERFWELRGWIKSDERAALNHIVQGTAADIIKLNLIQMYGFTNANQYRTHCSIHDEIIISVPTTDLTPELIEKIENIMTQTATISTPLKTDIVIMERWMDEVKPKDWDFECGCAREEAA